MPAVTAKRPTLADVAQEAGVSTGTVSAVVNRKPTVAPDTRELVLGVIDRMGYRPPYAAAPAAETGGNGVRPPQTVTVIVRELDNPYYAEVLLGARGALAARGYKMSAMSSEGDFAEEGSIIRACRSQAVRGLVVAPVVHAEADLTHLFQLKRAGFPFVLLGEVAGLQAPAVHVDGVEAAEQAVAHLVALGHRRIVHLAGPGYTPTTRDRVVGVRQAFGSSPLVFTPDAVVEAGAHFGDGYRATRDLFAARTGADRPTALFAFNDLVAMGALRALAEAGLDVPGDVSVVGFDDIPAAAYLSVPLTTVRVPKREVGARAADLLLDRIGGGGAAERVALPSSLVVRASTRPL